MKLFFKTFDSSSICSISPPVKSCVAETQGKRKGNNLNLLGLEINNRDRKQDLRFKNGNTVHSSQKKMFIVIAI